MYTDLFLALLNEKNARGHPILSALIYAFCPAAAYWWLAGAVPELPFDPIWRSMEDLSSSGTLKDHLLRYGFDSLLEEVRKYIEEVSVYRKQHGFISSPELSPFFAGGKLEMSQRFGSQHAIEKFGGDWHNLFTYVRTWAFLSQDWRGGMGIDMASNYTFCGEKVHLVLPIYRLPVQFDAWMWKVSIGHVIETKIGLLGDSLEQDQLRYSLMRRCQPPGKQPWPNAPAVYVLDPSSGEAIHFERKLPSRSLEGIVDYLAGNERQRRAIDELHQAYKQWAVQDLRLKRGAISSQIRIDDLIAWLTKTTSLAFGRKTSVMDCQLHNAPVTALEFRDTESGTTVVLALESPQVLIPILKRKHSAIRGNLSSNPLLRLGTKTPAVELSILNAGTMFDIEFPVVWNSLTGQATQANVVWAYILR